MKETKSENYKYVVHRVDGKREQWIAKTPGNGTTVNSKSYPTEREAAIAVDRKLIEMGKEPVNILKRKM